MCTLRELDVQSRAAVSLVEEWQREHEAVRAIWKLEDVIQLIVAASRGSVAVRERVVARGEERVADAKARQTLICTITYFLDALRRLRAAIQGIVPVVSMFESEGYRIESAKDLREQQAILPDIIKDVEGFQESLEWEELEDTAIPSATIRAVADR